MPIVLYLTLISDVLQHPLANWSCVYYDDQVVILSEEGESTTQYFYPISVLQQQRGMLMSKSLEPIHQTGMTPPSHSYKTTFIFPVVTMSFGEGSESPPYAISGVSAVDTATSANQPSNALASSSNSPTRCRNPCPSPPWYPDSAHFVRQWWPVVPNMPHISCTVILLATHDPTTHRTVYTLTQHYLTVTTPKTSEVGEEGESHGTGLDPTASEDRGVGVKHKDNGSSMKMWYASRPFEVACIADGAEEADDPDTQHSNYRPLMAVDFGHAVWIEDDVDADQDDVRLQEGKSLRFVTFPSVDADPWEDNGGMAKFVSTLKIPDELDLGLAETINIDQSQGAVIISVKEGKVFILFYE